MKVKLTDGNSVVSLIVGCDQTPGCEGSVNVTLKTPVRTSIDLSKK